MTTTEFIWQIIFIAAFALAGAMLCHLRAREAGGVSGGFDALLKRSRHLYGVVLLVVALPLINLVLAARPSAQWNMPVWLQYHWAALSWGLLSGVLAYVFGFCSVAASVTSHPWKWGLAVFGGIVLSVIQGYAAWNSLPKLPPLEETRLSEDGVILQTSDFTCVPASGANIAAILGVHTSERELARLFHTTRDGTFPARALRGMAELGIDGKKCDAGLNIHNVHPPAMLFVLNDTHAVVYTGIKGGRVEILNPSEGRDLLPEWQLCKIWDGHALEFSRGRN